MPATKSLPEIMRISPVVPLIRMERLEYAVPLAKALVAGGLRVAEVCLRSPHAFEAISAMRLAVPSLTLGAGCVSRPAEFALAIDAGAAFAVSCGLSAALIVAAQETGLPLIPGVMTPSEAMHARDAGFFEQHFSPAAHAGSFGMLHALASTLPELIFFVSGGITQHNAMHYLACDNVACVGGAWVTPADVMARGDWAGITALAYAAANFSSATFGHSG